MKTQMNPVVGMTTLVLNFATLSFLPHTHAQVQATSEKVMHWKCEAECFVIQADGSTLSYAGAFVSSAYKKREQAFRELKFDFCGNGNLLLKRKFQRVIEQNTAVDVTEHRESRYWHYSSSTSTHRIRHYRITSTDLRAVFDAVEATEGNACSLAPKEEERQDYTPWGDRILG